METQNRELRLSKDPKAELKKFESEVAFLKQQLSEYQKSDANKANKNDAVIKKELSLEEQARIQRELAQSDLIIKGYHDENQKVEAKLRDLSSQVRAKDKEIIDLKRQMHEVQIKKMLESDKVYVESKNEEVDLQTANVMGPSNSISQKQLKDMQDAVSGLRNENDQLKRDWNLKE